MKKKPRTNAQLLDEIEDLQRRLEEAEETLRAIHEGEVDALVVSKPQGEFVFTLKGAEHPYRVFVEAMSEGAATLDAGGTILYSNNRFAEMLKLTTDKVIGSSIHRFIPPADRSGFESAFQAGKQQDTTVGMSFMREDQAMIPVHLSFNLLHGQEAPVVCMVAMDLTEHKRLEGELRRLNAELEQRVQDRTSELRESEQRWATTLASIGDAVIATDLEGRVRFMNAVAEELTGWTMSEASQKPAKQVFNIINEITRLEAENPVTKVLESGLICGLANHTLLVRKDGTEVAIDDSGAPIRDETGKTMGVVLVFRDITERRRAEEALRDTQERLAIAVEAGKLGIHDYDVTSGMIRWDRRLREIWGVKQDDPITYDTFISGLHPDDRAATQAAVDKALNPRGDGNYYAEYRVINRRDEMTRWVAATGQVFFEKDRAARLVGTVVDVTERKRVEEALRASESRFRAIFENSVDAVFMTDPRDEGKILFANPAACRMLGWTEDELIGKDREFILDTDDPNLASLLQDRQRSGSKMDEITYRRKDGTRFPGELTTAIFHDSKGEERAVAIVRDITERKRTEEALRRARNELEARVEERTKELRDAVAMLENEIAQRERLEGEIRNSEKQIRSFASQILTAQETERRRIAGELHDSVAGGLTGIKFMVERALQNGLPPAEMENLTSKIKTAIEETRRIMAALRPGILDDLGVLAALGWLSREFNQTHPDINVTRELEIEETQVPDPLKTPIFRITQEALNNIAKHSKSDLVTIWLRKKGDSIELMIQDNGRGFNIAETFSTEGHTKDGLGLSSMRERAELSGGAFSVESSPGSGTRITATWVVRI
jgi:PAS domain S-box-containing protein